jgi:hypothetical protein
MGLVVRKVQGGAQDRIRSLVAEHAQSLEAGLSVLDTSLRLGRTTIDVVALDAKQTLVLVVAGEVADEKMLVGTLDAYVWCLAHPESVQRRYPAATIAITRPPRIIFVAERVPQPFMELLESLSVVPVECQELHIPTAPAPVAPTAAPAAPAKPVTPPAPAVAAPVAPAPSPAASRRMTPVTGGFDASVASQWESFVAVGPASHMATNGKANGHAPIAAPVAAQPLASPAIAIRATEASVEPPAPPRQASPAPAAPQPAAAPVVPAPAAKPATPAGRPAAPAPKSAAPADPESNHPALESLKFPKDGVSRQWQDFLDQLAAANQ